MDSNPPGGSFITNGVTFVYAKQTKYFFLLQGKEPETSMTFRIVFGPLSTKTRSLQV